MSKKPPVEETHPHLSGFFEFLEDFNKETDRGAALAAAAMVDDLVGETVEAFLIDNKGRSALLSGFNAPLGTFASRCAAAFALGLISEREFQECALVRKIRNEFAHQVKVSFETDKIVGLCSQLTMAAADYDDVRVGTRGRFTTAAVALILNLTNRPHYVAKERLSYSDWPY